MEAIELNYKTDKKGHLKIDYPLNLSEKKVRVIILMEDDNIEEDEEKLWMQAILRNPSLEFLNDNSEDIYTINDGEEFND